MFLQVYDNLHNYAL